MFHMLGLRSLGLPGEQTGWTQSYGGYLHSLGILPIGEAVFQYFYQFGYTKYIRDLTRGYTYRASLQEKPFRAPWTKQGFLATINVAKTELVS